MRLKAECAWSRPVVISNNNLPIFKTFDEPISSLNIGLDGSVDGLESCLVFW